MILGANYAEYAELDKLNPHNPRNSRLKSFSEQPLIQPKFVSSRLLDNSAVDAFVQHF